MAPRWKVKPQGFATVKVDGWWQKPGEPNAPAPTVGGPASPRAPQGGTTSTVSAAARRNAQAPREWVGSEGLIGNWAKAPRLNPDQFEFLQNPDTKRWWARPRDELTGLGTQARADIRGFDRQTTAQQARIDAAYGQFVAESGQNAQAGTAGLQGLTALTGSGYSGDPTGAVLSEAARKQAGAGVAPMIADLARMPGIAREAGITASTSYAADRGNTRAETISGYRTAASEAASAEADRAAELRGQELESLGRAAGLKNDLDIANIRADSDAADRASRERMNDADNATSVANAEARIRAAEVKDAKKKGRKPPTANDIRQWAKRARTMWNGENTGRKDDEGNPLFANYAPQEIIHELMAAGATRKRAVAIVRNITGLANPMQDTSAYVPPSTWGW